MGYAQGRTRPLSCQPWEVMKVECSGLLRAVLLPYVLSQSRRGACITTSVQPFRVSPVKLEQQ